MTAQIIPVDPDNARTLARHATEIRRLGKQVVSDVIEIGRLLVESKKLAGHGNWLSWLEKEFGWTDKTAENFMNVARFSAGKIETVSNLNLPMRGLYLLAAPSTPETATQEVISRAEAGEPVTLNTVKEIVGRAKQDDRRGPRVEVETHRDAGKQHKDAGRAKQPYVERWVPQSNGLIETMLIWPIKSAQHHLEDSMRAVKEFKPKMSEAELRAVAVEFHAVEKIATAATDEMLKKLRAVKELTSTAGEVE
jgi:Protein of unknown function (DUF3102)